MSLGEHSHFALYARAARSLDTCSLLPFTEASGNRNSVRNFRTDLGVRRVLGMGTGFGIMNPICIIAGCRTSCGHGNRVGRLQSEAIRNLNVC